MAGWLTGSLVHGLGLSITIEVDTPIISLDCNPDFFGNTNILLQ